MGREDDNLYHRLKAHRLTLKNNLYKVRATKLSNTKSTNVRGGKTNLSPGGKFMNSSLPYTEADGLNRACYKPWFEQLTVRGPE